MFMACLLVGVGLQKLVCRSAKLTQFLAVVFADAPEIQSIGAVEERSDRIPRTEIVQARSDIALCDLFWGIEVVNFCIKKS